MTNTTGPRGHQGERGEAGPQGAQGAVGSRGPQGSDGQRGPQGHQGLQGDQGPQGVQGVAGHQGAQGIQGNTGSPGVLGPQGPQGPQGFSGLDGAQGPQGDNAVSTSMRVATYKCLDMAFSAIDEETNLSPITSTNGKLFTIHNNSGSEMVLLIDSSRTQGGILSGYERLPDVYTAYIPAGSTIVYRTSPIFNDVLRFVVLSGVVGPRGHASTISSTCSSNYGYLGVSHQFSGFETALDPALTYFTQVIPERDGPISQISFYSNNVDKNDVSNIKVGVYDYTGNLISSFIGGAEVDNGRITVTIQQVGVVAGEPIFVSLKVGRSFTNRLSAVDCGWVSRGKYTKHVSYANSVEPLIPEYTISVGDRCDKQLWVGIA